MEFSDKLKELRKSKGITQEELANSVFVSRSVIAKYESGNALPTRENAEKLAVYFGVKLSYLIDEEEQVKMTLAEIKTRKIISYIISTIGIIINSFYLIICFIPIFSKLIYIYPIPEGADRPMTRYDHNSIISATLSHNNPLGIITFALCIIDLILFIIFLIATKHKKISLVLEFLSIITLIINIFLIILTFIFSASYAL